MTSNYIPSIIICCFAFLLYSCNAAVQTSENPYVLDSLPSKISEQQLMHLKNWEVFEREGYVTMRNAKEQPTKLFVVIKKGSIYGVKGINADYASYIWFTTKTAVLDTTKYLPASEIIDNYQLLKTYELRAVSYNHGSGALFFETFKKETIFYQLDDIDSLTKTYPEYYQMMRPKWFKKIE